ncbi:MAG TPA: SDR family NAD(P)-dependent oxidoreductase [Candidatus Binatia bacterium]
MNCAGREILVTGAAGFIGSHLVEELVKRGNKVRAFVRHTSLSSVGHLVYLPDKVRRTIRIIAGDVRDPDAVRRAADGCDVIFHLAASIAIPYSYLHPREVLETNLMGTLNVLTAARDLKVSRMIHTSTSEVYGTAQSVPIDERHPLQGQSPYAASKIAADKLAQSFYRSFEIPVAIVRPFNTYGPRQSDRAVIPMIISQGLVRDEIKLGSLEPSRDFTYVTDTVQGFIKIAEVDDALGQEINLGTGRDISIGELARMICSLLGKESFQIVEETSRLRPKASEVWRLQADNSKAKRLAGWEPNVALAEGLRETIGWISQHLDLYQASNPEGRGGISQ